MTGAADYLLNRYPSSFAKSQAARMLLDVERLPASNRSLRFVVYDIIYAFQQLEARRLGIRPDRHPIQYAEFRRNYIGALAMWVPGKDQLIDGIREAIEANIGGRYEELGTILEQLHEAAKAQTRTAQSRNAANRHPLKTIDHYIIDTLRENPRISEKGLWQKIESDCENLTDERIGEIEHDGVWVIDPMPKGKSRSQFHTRSSLRSRLSRMRGKFKSSH